jgi:hypothetical protein
MFPVQFCLQPDNTFVVQSQGNFLDDPADDSNVVKLCSASGAVYLTTASKAPYNGCLTARLQIAPVPNRFRIRLASNSQYLTGGGGTAVPANDETAFYQTPDSNLALIFENVPGQSGRVVALITWVSRSTLTRTRHQALAAFTLLARQPPTQTPTCTQTAQTSIKIQF